MNEAFRFIRKPSAGRHGSAGVSRDQRPLLARMRRRQRWLRAIAVVVAAAFLNLYLQPLAVAAQSIKTIVLAEPDNGERLAKTLKAIESKLERLDQKLANSAVTDTERAELRSLRQQLSEQDKATLHDFAQIEQRLKDGAFPQVLLDRHREAVKQYQADMTDLHSRLDAVDQAGDDNDRKLEVQKTRTFLKEKQKKRSHAPLDPSNLPFRTPDGKARKPRQTEQELRALFPAERVQLAALDVTPRMLVPVTLAGPTPADLAPTEDVQITDDIKALATSLGNNPAKIYNWVHNNIEFVPTYGSVQGSAMTLAAKRGNAFDTASLLIALLRAANVPARYVYGTVLIPATKVMNWVGGVSTPESAQDILGQGGIPNVAVVQGGRIADIRLEHVWVEAYVDAAPSRGAINKQLDSWMRLDPSFKQYQFTPGLDIRSNVPFDPQAFLTQLRVSAQVNEAEGWATGFDENYVRAAIADYQGRVKAHIDATKPNATMSDVIGARTITPTTSSVLPTGLPYRLIATGSRFGSFPSSLRHAVTLTLYASDLDRALGSPDVSYTVSLPFLNIGRLGVTYEPASPADAQLIQSYKDQGATSLPVYLIRVRPAVQLDGVTVAAGSVVSMGQAQIWDLNLYDPSGFNTATDAYPTTAGDEIVVGINGNGIAPEVVQKRLDQANVDSAAENLQQVALHYWMESDLFDGVAARSHGVHKQRLPSAGFFSSPLAVRYLFGLPKSGNYGGRQMDVKRAVLAVTGADQKTRFAFMSQAGAQGSYLEGSVFDQLFYKSQGKGISAAQLLLDANRGGIPIYTVTQANVNSVLPQLAVSDSVKSDIAAAVGAGKTAVVPKTELTKGAWSGTGYVIQDAVTGAGAYLLDGGLNGGFNSTCGPSVVPVVSTIVLGILAMLLASLVAQAASAVTIGALVTTAGTLMFVVAGPLIPLLIYALAFIIVAIVFAYMLAQLVERGSLYPPFGFDDCSCQEHLNRCLESGLSAVKDGFQSRCVSCFDRCDKVTNSWPPSIEVGTCAYWNY